jgi:hypothetical protein
MMGTAKTGTGGGGLNKDELQANIMSVEFLDRTGNVFVNTICMYVNIPDNSKYIDGTTIKSDYLLGRVVKCKVKFNRRGNHNFKIRLNTGVKNIIYTNSEKTRNPNFKYHEQDIQFTTDSNGEKIVEDNRLVVSPAGGDIFALSVTDETNKTVYTTGRVMCMRGMYFVELKMKGLTTTPSSLDRFRKEYEKHYIYFSKLQDAEIPFMENIGAGNDTSLFLQNVQSEYNISQGPAKKPYCIAVAYTGHLAVKEIKEISQIVTVGGINPVNIAIQDTTTNKNYPLWDKIVSGEDWFIDCNFVPNGSTRKIPVAKVRCTLVQNPNYVRGYCDSININTRGVPASRGIIKIKVNCINRMRAGLSFKNTNIVTICTRAWWKNISANEQNDVIIHEIGHQIGMVANGTGILPDKTATFYDKAGHVGNHCHSGIPAGQTQYDSENDRKLSTCVMYGATNGHADFCPNCVIAVKKLDLSKGVK